MAETAVAVRNEIIDQLTTVNDALPKDFNKTRFASNAIALMTDHPDLMKFGKSQLYAGLMKAAVLGLDFISGDCYLIPYGSQLQYQTSYRGMEKLAMKYSIKPIDRITSGVIRKGDEFTVETGEHGDTYTHKRNPFSSDKVIGAYAAVWFKDGTRQVETMSEEELETTRSQSKAKNAMAWSKFTTEMYRKVVTRRLLKHISISMENAQQEQIYNSEDQLETDPKEIAKNSISANANQTEFVVDSEVVENKEDG